VCAAEVKVDRHERHLRLWHRGSEAGAIVAPEKAERRLKRVVTCRKCRDYVRVDLLSLHLEQHASIKRRRRPPRSVRSVVWGNIYFLARARTAPE
jgi:hypothetical protein